MQINSSMTALLFVLIIQPIFLIIPFALFPSSSSILIMTIKGVIGGIIAFILPLIVYYFIAPLYINGSKGYKYDLYFCWFLLSSLVLYASIYSN